MKTTIDVMNRAQRHKAVVTDRGRAMLERAFASALWRKGLRYLTHRGYEDTYGEALQGRPDIVFPRKRVVVFVDGCFWHGCRECGKHLGLTGKAWKDNIETQKTRNLQVTATLRDAGWIVFRIPEHDISTKATLSETADRVASLIRTTSSGRDSGPVREFVLRHRPADSGSMTAVSLFAGAGLSDLGYALAGFRFVLQVEKNKHRASIGASNFPSSRWLVADVRGNARGIEAAYREYTSRDLDLLIATPPCQGMSSANPSRGKRQAVEANAQELKNRLMLEVVPVADLLNPRVIVAENVRQVLTVHVGRGGEKERLIDKLRRKLRNYEVYHCVVNVADYGIPQVRNRALVVAVRKDEPCLKGMISDDLRPWPFPTHAEHPGGGRRPWVNIHDWMASMRYEPLDAVSAETARGRDSLHFVPVYESERYGQISQIPPYSGRSAFENDTCVSCGRQSVEEGSILCSCGAVMRNRPYVERDGRPTLIKGFHSSYRRMKPGRPAYTVTTNSSHIGSDFKIHPWENRVLSILECADLQTVPRFYDWTQAQNSRKPYLIRNLIGEAFPTYFTYLHGQVLARFLSGSGPLVGEV